MKTCEYDGEALTEVRAHPWSDAVANPDFRYYDLKESPALIRTVLEDFLPWGGFPAVDQFYELLEWLNGPASIIESNDCAFTPPRPSTNPQFRKSLECSGRVMVLFRELARNVAPHGLRALANAFHNALAPADPSFEFGVVGTTLSPVRYRTLPGPARAQLGSQLMISFWAFGDNEGETMAHLSRLMTNLSRALRDTTT